MIKVDAAWIVRVLDHLSQSVSANVIQIFRTSNLYLVFPHVSDALHRFDLVIRSSLEVVVSCVSLASIVD